MNGLKGKVALVTGGARGLGEAICRVLGEAGMVVVAGDVRYDQVHETAARLRDTGAQVSALQLDVSNEEQAAEAMREIIDTHGRLDVLVNNAGIDVTLPVEELTVGDWDRVMAVNLRGPFVMSKLALPYMRQQGSGHIINIVSTAAKRAWPNASVYHASKWGLLGFTESLHTEARQIGIKVTAVIAGGMRTPFLLDRFPDIDMDALQDPENVALTVRYVLTTPKETVIPEVMVLPMRETSWP